MGMPYSRQPFCLISPDADVFFFLQLSLRTSKTLFSWCSVRWYLSVVLLWYHTLYSLSHPLHFHSASHCSADLCTYLVSTVFFSQHYGKKACRIELFLSDLIHEWEHLFLFSLTRLRDQQLTLDCVTSIQDYLLYQCGVDRYLLI